MNEKLKNYLNGVFAPYDEVKSVTELKADLLSDLQERFLELKAEGKDDEIAFKMTIDSIGDIEQTLNEVANFSSSQEGQVVINFNASNLPMSDFAGVKSHKAKFGASDLHDSNFSGADLTGSSFTVSNLCGANFDGANLTDCNLSTNDLADASFNKTIFIRTHFNMSGLDGAKFTDVKLTDVKFTMTDLRKTIFENCIFNGVEFKYSDLQGVCFDGQTFISVKFDKTALNNASFKDTTLRNVSFVSAIILSKKYYRAIKTICFDGATMDKLTYVALKGMEADLSKVTVI
ncbi:MAG: pentapeptide repeat-containing protein [Candidatus Gracilibacteria bacterium]